MGEEFSRLLERDIVLKSMDTMWSSFLDESQSLRQAIGFRGYAQKDPKLEFKLEMGTLWDLMVKEVRILATEDLLKKMPRLPPAMTTPPPSDSDATPTDG